MKCMERLMAGGVLLAACLTGYAQAPDLAGMDIVEKAVPAGPVAVVDDEPISRESFLNAYRQYIRPLQAMAEGKVTDAERVKAGLQVLRKQLQEKVLLATAREKGLSVSSSEVQQAYDAEMKALQDAVLKQTGESKSEADVLGVSGRTRAQALEAIEEGMLIEKAARQIAENTMKPVPEAEIKRIYEENKAAFRKPGGMELSQIFIKPQVIDPSKREGAFAEARKEAEKALGRVRAGEKFETVAKDMSDAPDARRGGDLGVRPEEALPPFYREALKEMKVGDLSGVIQSEHGFHIIRLEGLQDADYASIEEARPQIEGMVRGRGLDEAIYNFCQPVIADPERVEIFLQLEKTMIGSDTIPPELAPSS